MPIYGSPQTDCLTATGSEGSTLTAIKTTNAKMFGYYIFNSNSSTVYMQVFDDTTANITLGTTSPKLSLGIPAGAGANLISTNGITFANAITIAFTTTRSGSTAPTNTVDYNIFYI